MFAMSEGEYAAANAWLEQTALLPLLEENANAFKKSSDGVVDTMLDKVMSKFLDAWQEEAHLKTYRQAVAEVIAFRASGGESFDMTTEEWLAFSRNASWYEARQKARSLGIDLEWDCERAKTPEGYPGRS